MDYYTIVAQRALLERELVGKKIETVRLREYRDLFLGFEGETALKLACIPDMPYLHRMEKRFIPRRDAQDWHHSRFVGKRLVSVIQTPGDRILTFTADSGFSIVFELTGRNANLLVLNPDGLITGTVRVITGRESGYRTIRPGVSYAPPPPRELPDLAATPPEMLTEVLRSRGGTVLAALSGLCGGSRLLAGEALLLAEVDSAAPVDSISDDDAIRALTAAAGMVRVVERGGDGGTLVLDERENLPRDVFPLPMIAPAHPGRFFEDLDEAVTVYARDREIALERKSLRQTVISALTREERTVRATMEKVERERGGESEPERLERRADTLLASLHLIEPGMESVRLPDPYDGGEVEVELDPALDGAGNADRLYSRARKLRAAGRLAGERLASLERRLADIRAERETLESLTDLRALRTMAARYTRRAASSREPDIEEKFPRRFTSVSGLEIIVGRNDEENDELVRWARRDDVWLHAQGVGGSHVVLRAPNKQTPDHRSIEQAASIAAYYSKAKTSAVVPVAWTLVKYVVKRKGQGPGQVTYTREKVVFVEPAKMG